MKNWCNAAVLAVLVAGIGAGAQAQDRPTTRLVTPQGVTITYPGATSGLPHGQVASMQAAPDFAGNPNELGTFAIAAPPSAAMPTATMLQPNGSTVAQNIGAVQAFASGAPNAGVDSAPPPPPRGFFVSNWSAVVPDPVGCPWTHRRRC